MYLVLCCKNDSLVLACDYIRSFPLFILSNTPIVLLLFNSELNLLSLWTSAPGFVSSLYIMRSIAVYDHAAWTHKRCSDGTAIALIYPTPNGYLQYNHWDYTCASSQITDLFTAISCQAPCLIAGKLSVARLP